MPTPAKLIFVYNANSGKWNAALDTMHKLISPDTYQCSLCQITYGAFSEQPDWKEFRESFPGEMQFLHIDEFEKDYPKRDSYPVVLSETSDGTLEEVLSTEALNNMGDQHNLITFFRQWAGME